MKEIIKQMILDRCEVNTYEELMEKKPLKISVMTKCLKYENRRLDEILKELYHNDKYPINLYYLFNENATNRCKICGKETAFQNFYLGFSKYCGTVCLNNDKEHIELTKAAREKALMDKYGVKNVMDIPEYRNKIKQTNLEKYGVENVMHVDEIKEKQNKNVKKVFKENKKQIQEKTKQTNLEKYGVEYALQVKEIRDKCYNTIKEKYGVDNPQQNEEIKNKARKTNLERYGAENPFQSEEIKEKIKQTNLERYGCENPIQTLEVQEKIKLKKFKTLFNRLISINRLNDIEPLFNENDYCGANIKFKYKFKCKKCNTVFEDHLDNGRIPRCTTCYPPFVSKLEIEIREYIKTIYNGELMFNDRSILGHNLELDIVIPDLNVAIEVNGDYWHSDDKKPAGYHENKSVLSENNGYKLYFIWEYEWNEKLEETKEKIKNIIFDNIN
jgi:hypothetical protein